VNRKQVKKTRGIEHSEGDACNQRVEKSSILKSRTFPDENYGNRLASSAAYYYNTQCSPRIGNWVQRPLHWGS
jgi:hypothetical protein